MATSTKSPGAEASVAWGTATPWSTTGNAGTSDASYDDITLAGLTWGEWIVLTDFDFASEVDPASTIQGLSGTFEWKADNAGIALPAPGNPALPVGEVSLALVIGGVVQETLGPVTYPTDPTTVEGAVNFGGAAEDWGGISIGDALDSGFGIAYRWHNTLSKTRTGYLNFNDLTLHFTEPAGSTGSPMAKGAPVVFTSLPEPAALPTAPFDPSGLVIPLNGCCCGCKPTDGGLPINFPEALTMTISSGASSPFICPFVAPVFPFTLPLYLLGPLCFGDERKTFSRIRTYTSPYWSNYIENPLFGKVMYHFECPCCRFVDCSQVLEPPPNPEIESCCYQCTFRITVPPTLLPDGTCLGLPISLCGSGPGANCPPFTTTTCFYDPLVWIFNAPGTMVVEITE